MKIDREKWGKLAAREFAAPSPEELRREENVFFVGGNLPERETIETLFESHFQCNASLFHLTFGESATFAQGEALARTIKKNFNTHLLGRLNFAAASPLIERAYAAGIDIIDIPLSAGKDATDGFAADPVFHALEAARAVFPRWGVASTLVAGAEPASVTLEKIDALLGIEVVPLLTLSGRAAGSPPGELSRLYTHLQGGWRAKKALIKPLLPLIYLTSPLVPASPPGMLRGLIDRIEERRLLATSDLRRVLRVKEVEESYASSGL